MNTKTCIDCEQIKHIDMFYFRPKGILQRRAECKECTTARALPASIAYRKSHRAETIWRGILYRCYNPCNKGYKNYGGRGIFVCDSWLNSFESFKNWYDSNYIDGMSVDRIDNDGPYSPDNCRFSTHAQQMKNRRFTELRRSILRGATEKRSVVAKQKSELPTKICAGCKVDKPREFFGFDKGRVGNIAPYCKQCVNSRCKARRGRNKL